MANKKITDLNEIFYIKSASDFIVLEDISANQTKKARPENLPLSLEAESQLFPYTLWIDNTEPFVAIYQSIDDTEGFKDLTTLEYIYIGVSVTGIGDNTFQGCSNLTTVNVPDGVTNLGSYAFYLCSNCLLYTSPSPRD